MVKLALNLSEKGGCIEVLMGKARNSGTMDREELLKCIKSHSINEKEQINSIVQMIEEMGIKVT